MFRILGLCFLLILTRLEGASHLSTVLFDERGGPSSTLLHVLSAFQISSTSWEEIVSETQEKWLRKKERWEIGAIQDCYPERSYQLFSSLNMTQTLYNESCQYHYGVVLGATLQVVRQRFWFLKQAWDQGVRFDTLVLLTGDRSLDPNLENQQNLIDPDASPYPFKEGWQFSGNSPKNETEMMLLVLEQLDLPSEWAALPLSVVDTPRPIGATRPQTSHTLDCWMDSHPQPGSLLLVSSQPFAGRQEAITRQHLPSSFTIDCCAEGFSLKRFKEESRALAILQDELARWIYTEIVEGSKIPSQPHNSL